MYYKQIDPIIIITSTTTDFVTANKMAEKSGSEEYLRNYKDIASIKRELKDPHKDRMFIGVTIAKNGSILAADYKNTQVCVFNRNGKLVMTFPLLNSNRVADIVELVDGNIAISDNKRECVAVYTANGEFVEELGRDILKSPYGLAVNKDGKFCVVSPAYSRIYMFEERRQSQYSFGCVGPEYDFIRPLFVCFDVGGLVYVTDHVNNNVFVFQQNGEFTCKFGSSTLDGCTGIAATNDGHLVVASKYSKKLSIFTTSGECVHEVKDVGLEEPYGVAVDDNGLIYVSDCSRSRIAVL